MTFLVIFRLTPIEHDSHNVSRAVLMKILSKSLTNLRFPSRPQGEHCPYVDCLQRYRIWNFPSINLLRFLLCFHLSMSRPVPSPSCAQSKAKAKASLKSTAIKSAAFSTFFESNLARYLIFAVTFYQTIWMFGLLLLPLRVEKGMFVVMITWKKASAKHRAEWIYMPCTTKKKEKPSSLWNLFLWMLQEAYLPDDNFLSQSFLCASCFELWASRSLWLTFCARAWNICDHKPVMSTQVNWMTNVNLHDFYERFFSTGGSKRFVKTASKWPFN